jgi:hypothetical protein
VYSDDSGALALLRKLCRRQGVTPEDADLEAVLGFLRAILPALEELERLVSGDLASAR